MDVEECLAVTFADKCGKKQKIVACGSIVGHGLLRALLMGVRSRNGRLEPTSLDASNVIFEMDTAAKSCNLRLVEVGIKDASSEK